MAPEAPKPELSPAFTAMTKEFDDILGGKVLDEIGLSDLEEITKKYGDLQKKIEQYSKDIEEALKAGTMSEEEVNKLRASIPNLKQKVEDRLKEIEVVKEAKEAIREAINNNILVANNNMKLLAAKKIELQNKVKEDIINGVDAATRDAKIAQITALEEQIAQYMTQVEDLKQDLIAIEKGGVVPKREPIAALDPASLTPLAPEAPKKDTPKPPAPEGAPKPTAPLTPPPRRKGAAPGSRVPTKQTIENLIKAGKLPKFLKIEDLLAICKIYNIPAVDKTTVLTPQQIKLLTEDYEIQVALLNQRIYEHNQTKIEQYDKLIAKYEAILKDKINERNFSPEYIKRVEDLLRKCQEERKQFVDRNEKIRLMTREELAHEFKGRAMNVNNNIRERYQELARLEEEKKKFKSKFRQRRIDAKIQKLLSRIERLKGKKATIATKQQQIVNNNNQKYIDKVTARLTDYMRRQRELEHSVDRMNELGERIDRSREEIDSLTEDIKNERNFFERVGMRIENGRLKREAGRLEDELLDEDYYGRHI